MLKQHLSLCLLIVLAAASKPTTRSDYPQLGMSENDFKAQFKLTPIQHDETHTVYRMPNGALVGFEDHVLTVMKMNPTLGMDAEEWKAYNQPTNVWKLATQNESFEIWQIQEAVGKRHTPHTFTLEIDKRQNKITSLDHGFH